MKLYDNCGEVNLAIKRRAPVASGSSVNPEMAAEGDICSSEAERDSTVVNGNVRWKGAVSI